MAFTGTFCGNNINECAGDPCDNGSQCIDGINQYTCNCAGTQYTGKNTVLKENSSCQLDTICHCKAMTNNPA